jgi:hypothetical protein
MATLITHALGALALLAFAFVVRMVALSFVDMARDIHAYRTELARVTAHRDHWQTLARTTLDALTDTADERDAVCLLVERLVSPDGDDTADTVRDLLADGWSVSGLADTFYNGEGVAVPIVKR